ncbi:AMP-binding protein [Arthrobacter sp. JCM 19049]|uniref:AMP-binding protein n=1 Tax=Arthrobacter sp. JCM 19049 TaxID=1460643 RepID=UPI0006D1F7AF|nr:AMP-binding protein [Arthrobacter sp. JCM 19049]
MQPNSLHEQVHTALSRAINEGGPAIEVVADAGTPEGARVEYLQPQQLPGFTDPLLVVRTSGSTGRAKRTVLSTAAMAASSQATAEFLGLQGQWLLALPVHYIAGLSVLTRSLFAGTTGGHGNERRVQRPEVHRGRRAAHRGQQAHLPGAHPVGPAAG